jgi:hypothetical protein
MPFAPIALEGCGNRRSPPVTAAASRRPLRKPNGQSTTSKRALVELEVMTLGPQPALASGEGEGEGELYLGGLQT